MAAIADRVTRSADPDKALLYVTCSSAAGGAALGNSQQYTADSICRTFLSQLYDLAVQGEDHVGLLESCNSVFKKAKVKNSMLPMHVRTDKDGLPEFVDAFSHIAALLKKSVVLVLDGLDRNALDEKNQEELLRKVHSLMAAVSDKAGIRVHILVGCASSTKFFNDLDLAPGAYIDVQASNASDIELVLTSALKDVPGLSNAEQEAAKIAILEKARSRFLYVRDTAIPFMREPFQRPLSKRLEALPDGTSDVYSKALSKMSPNYLDLLRTSLTWTLLAPEFPGFPHAREIMDAFQGTYDVPAEAGEEDEGVEAEFPVTSRLELEQLRGATDPFLKLFPESDGRVWVYESDAMAVAEYFIKSAADIHEVEEDHDHLCARCGSVRTAAKRLYIDPKEAHLQMALTCLRHLNNRLFQRRAGLLDVDSESDDSSDKEDASAQQDGEQGDTETTAPEAEGGDEAEDDANNEKTVDDYLQEGQDGYCTEVSIDDEDLTKPPIYEQDIDEIQGLTTDESEDDNPTRVRYELQYWPWHLRRAEELWSADERKDSSDWAALMAELDKFVFETPEVFKAWQSNYPEPEDEYQLFRFASGPHKPLHVAAYLGLTSWVRHLLDRGEELNGLSGGYSPLQAAACSGRSIETLKLLLEQGADVNAENDAGRTAFHLWFIKGEVTVEGVKMLLDHGADPRITCSVAHYNALQYFAARGDDPAVLDLLLAHGVDINAFHPEDDWKFPPLHVLLTRREVPGPLLEAFVKHNADTNSENAMSARPLQMVCTNGQFENLKILLQSEVLEMDDPDLHGTTAVHEATFFGHSKCVDLLLEHGADPDITDKLNRIALHTAARKGLVEAVRVLLKYSKQVNLLDKHGWSPLFCACLSKDEEAALLILDALIERNLSLAEINKPSRSGRTVLRQAADHGFDKVVSKLISLASPSDTASLALNASDTKKGMTALHRAAINGHAACVRALLAAGADPSLPDSQSRTALALAYERWSVANKTTSYEDILSQLITAAPAAATSDPDLVAVCAANGSVALLSALSSLNPNINFNRPDRFGWTPLDLARHFGRKDAEAFLKRQAAWASLLPAQWATHFPATTPVGAASVCEGGTRVLHTSGKRVCVSADRPLPPGLEGYYYEVTLLDVPGGKGDREWPEMAVGFCTLGGAALEFPGWWVGSDGPSTARSWGYHSDTGEVYSSGEELSSDRTVEELRYAVGDTVGAGVDLGKGEIWFTKNGVRLEKVVKGVEGRLFPVLGLHEEVCFETNFGRDGDGGFKWKSEVKVEGAEKEEPAVVKLVVLGGKEEAEKTPAVQVTSEEVVVVG